MQRLSSLETTHSGSSICKIEIEHKAEHIAQLFKYYWRLQNPYVSQTLPLKLVSGKKLYITHKDLFDKFAENAFNNKFDVEPFVKYCIRCGIKESNLEMCLSTPAMVSKYSIYIAKVNKRKSIYKWVLKSAKNIAKECIDLGYFTSKDFLRMLVQTKQIGSYVISGKISIYFFAAIPNFKKVIPKLDYFSRLELSRLYDHFEVYHSDVNKAFLQEKNTHINPIDFTDTVIWKLREKMQ